MRTSRLAHLRQFQHRSSIQSHSSNAHCSMLSRSIRGTRAILGERRPIFISPPIRSAREQFFLLTRFAFIFEGRSALRADSVSTVSFSNTSRGATLAILYRSIGITCDERTEYEDPCSCGCFGTMSADRSRRFGELREAE